MIESAVDHSWLEEAVVLCAQAASTDSALLPTCDLPDDFDSRVQSILDALVPTQLREKDTRRKDLRFTQRGRELRRLTLV